MKKMIQAVAIGFGIMSVFLYVPENLQAATNVLPNASFETVDPANSSRPQAWVTGRWGTNTTTFTYPSIGTGDSRAVSISMTARSTGDAKWTTGSHIPVTPGKKYEYTDSYISNVATHITLEIKLSDGTFQYPDLGSPAPSSSWATARYQFTAPSNAQSVRVFHLINQVGELKIDDVSLVEVISSQPPPIEPPPPPDKPPPPLPTDPDNLIANPSLESVNAAGLPSGWLKGRWGTNTTEFIFPIAGQSGANAARIQMSGWSSGDAKWYFESVPVNAAAAYEFLSYSKSSITTYITIQFKKSDGGLSYLDIGTRAPSNSWSQFKTTFTVPVGVVSMTVFHVIRGNGTLDIDSYSLKRTASDPTTFDKGYVSINFDDGWLSIYENAIPILNAAGFKSDQYITTDYLTGNYPGYVKPPHVLAMQQQGHVIGAHTRSHPDLTTLTATQLQAEVDGSRKDLINIAATPVNTFAYPFGGYNATVQQAVRSAGYTAGRSSDGGYNDKRTDKYALRRISMENTTTFAQVKGHIDAAMAEKKWVILLFHEINTSGHKYSISPVLFQQIVDYLKQKGITPITTEQGVAKMGQ